MAGSLTSTHQQLITLEVNWGLSRSTKMVHPRHQCLQDLKLAILEQQCKGHLVYIGADLNETPQEGQNKDGAAKLYSAAAFMENCNLDDLFQLHDGNTTTTKLENRYIDRIAGSGISCKRTGILPYLSMKTSNHRALYTDIDATSLFNNIPFPIAQIAQRKLTVGNQQSCDAFINRAMQQSVEHKVEERLKQLLFTFEQNSDNITQKMRNLHDAADKQMMKITTGSHNKC